MGEPGIRVAEWFGTFADLGRLPLTTIPAGYVIERLSQDFPVTAASFNSRDHNGKFTILIEPRDAIASVMADLSRDYERGELDRYHPLLTWYAVTGDPRAWTNGRVPSTMVSRRQREMHDKVMRPVEMEQQLSITYQMDGRMHRAFVLGRTCRDFSDDDVVVAGFIQRGLLALDAQTSLLSRLHEQSSTSALDAVTDTELTGRELAVLQLLVDGCSTRIIGRRLNCSPRTVEKHLEHVYRKLAVKDRVNAVRVARTLGLREAPPAPG